MRILLFANGDLHLPPGGIEALRPYTWIIAADGGARHCQELGLTPQLLVGDLDSLSPSQVSALQAAGTETVSYPTRKDYTDLELALQIALQRGVHEVIVLGALGARWDQTLANLLLPARAGLEEIHIRLLDGLTEVFLIRPNRNVALDGLPGDSLSLLPLTAIASGITSVGLEYPLENGQLTFGSTTGISNVLISLPASISMRSGLLLCVLTHQSKLTS